MTFNNTYNPSLLIPSTIENNNPSSASRNNLSSEINHFSGGTYVCNRANALPNIINNACGCVDCYAPASNATTNYMCHPPSSDYSIGLTSCSSTTFSPRLKNNISFTSSASGNGNQSQIIKNNLHINNNQCCPSMMISDQYYDPYSSPKNNIPLFVRLPPFSDFEYRRFPKFPKFPRFRPTLKCISMDNNKNLLKNPNFFNNNLKESLLRPNGMLQTNIPCPSYSRKIKTPDTAVNNNNLCNNCNVHKNVHFPVLPMMSKTLPPPNTANLPPSLPFAIPLPLPCLPTQSNSLSINVNDVQPLAPSFFSANSEHNRIFPYSKQMQGRNGLLPYHNTYSNTTSNNIIHHNNVRYIRRLVNGDRSDDSADIEKPYACIVCYRTFKRKHNMLIHQRVHTSEAFLCAYCEKPFARKSNLKQHLRVHTGERPFKCCSCSKAFTQSHSLKDHRKIHNVNEGEKSLVMCE